MSPHLRSLVVPRPCIKVATCGFTQSSPPTSSSRVPYLLLPLYLTSFVTDILLFAMPLSDVTLMLRVNCPFVTWSTAEKSLDGIMNSSTLVAIDTTPDLPKVTYSLLLKPTTTSGEETIFPFSSISNCTLLIFSPLSPFIVSLPCTTVLPPKYSCGDALRYSNFLLSKLFKVSSDILSFDGGGGGGGDGIGKYVHDVVEGDNSFLACVVITVPLHEQLFPNPGSNAGTHSWSKHTSGVSLSNWQHVPLVPCLASIEQGAESPAPGCTAFPHGAASLRHVVVGAGVGVGDELGASVGTGVGDSDAEGPGVGVSIGDGVGGKGTGSGQLKPREHVP